MDINHTWGQDIQFGPDNDLSMVDGDTELRQRLLRRIMTCDAIVDAGGIQTVNGDYPFHQDYGGSAPRRIGQQVNRAEIESQITAQMLQEQGVSQNPAPTVTTRAFSGGVECRLVFTSALTGQQQVLEFTI